MIGLHQSCRFGWRKNNLAADFLVSNSPSASLRSAPPLTQGRLSTCSFFLHYPPNFKLISSIVEHFLFCAFSYHREPYRSVLFWARGDSGRDKKDAESSKTASSPYRRTAETVFGGRKSENIKLHAGIRKDSNPLSAIWDMLKLNYNNLFSLFRSALF